jgi:hypothetical protein
MPLGAPAHPRFRVGIELELGGADASRAVGQVEAAVKPGCAGTAFRSGSWKHSLLPGSVRAASPISPVIHDG